MVYEQAFKLRLAGYSYAEIGKKMTVSRQRIQQLLSPPARIRDRVITSAQGKCQGCDLFVGSNGHIHHKGIKRIETQDDYNKINNLVLLCISCHSRAHGRNTILHKTYPRTLRRRQESNDDRIVGGKQRRELAKGIQEYRKDNGLTQDALAQLVRLSRRTIHRAEHAEPISITIFHSLRQFVGANSHA